MPYIDVIPPDRATGLLKKLYDAALKRAGRIWGIVSVMSPNPPAMKASLDFYGTLMHGPSPSAARGGRCSPWWSRPRTTACTEFARTPTTSVPRSPESSTSRTARKPTGWCISWPRTGAGPTCRPPTARCAPSRRSSAWIRVIQPRTSTGFTTAPSADRLFNYTSRGCATKAWDRLRMRPRHPPDNHVRI